MSLKEELIDKYFEGKLSPEEQQKFDALIGEQEDFAQEVAMQLALKNALRNKERAKLKMELKAIETNIPKGKVIKPWWVLAAAASMFLVGAFAYQFIFKAKNHENLFQEYYQTYPNVVSPTVRGENGSTLKQQAFSAYDKEDYQMGLRLFQQLHKEQPSDFAVFYEALCYLELDDSSSAIELLESNRFSDEPYPFETNRQWYLALSYLKVGETAKAKTLLDELSKTPYQQEKMGEELLKRLP